MATVGTATQLLLAWSRGDDRALDQLAVRVDGALRQLARRQMARETTGHTLQPTALINEVYLRLIDAPRVEWRDRLHFFAMAARLMRHILVDHARAKRNLKRGGGFRRVPLSAVLTTTVPANHDLLVRLDDALTTLAAFDARRSQVVELRFFGGLGVEEIADVLGISAETVMRDWKLARAWLQREMARG